MNKSQVFNEVLISHVEAALVAILPFTVPADTRLTRYFSTHTRLGVRDRRIVADAVYDILRHKRWYDYLATTYFAEVTEDVLEGANRSATRRLALLGLIHAGYVYSAVMHPLEQNWLASVMQIDSTSLPLSHQTNLPDWLLDRLIKQMELADILACAKAMNVAAPLDIRVNRFKTTRQKVLAELSDMGIEACKTPYAPDGLRIVDKQSIEKSALFEKGKIDIQDEGSQLLCHIVGARRGEMIVDFCAGAGGKSLALGALMRNTGQIYALDVVASRLAQLTPRLLRSGLTNIASIVIKDECDTKIRRFYRKMDRVLVDAPCTGLGTLRRHPDLRFRITSEEIAVLHIKQLRILSGAAMLVKPGGRLIYATCSLLEEENEQVANEFLLCHPDFMLVPIEQVLSEQKITLAMKQYLKLLPHIHETDGFFAAVFRRNEKEK